MCLALAYRMYATCLPTYWMLVTFTALYTVSPANLGLSGAASGQRWRILHDSS